MGRHRNQSRTGTRSEPTSAPLTKILTRKNPRKELQNPVQNQTWTLGPGHQDQEVWTEEAPGPVPGPVQDLDQDQDQLLALLTMSAVGSSCSLTSCLRKVVVGVGVGGGSQFQVGSDRTGTS